MNWFNRLLDQNQNPSLTSLILLAASITGLGMCITSIFLDSANAVNTSNTGIWLVGLSVGGKGLQHFTNK
jgi:hypothetical protein